MPKVIFTEEARRNAALTALIDSRIGRGRRFRTLADLAEALHMPRQTFYQKLRAPAEKFSYWQVCEIFRLLRATDREVAQVKYAGATKAEDSAALEDNEELSFLEFRGLARLYGCKIAYLTAPELAVVDPTANKGKRRRRVLADLAKQVGPLEHEQFRVENLLGAMGRGDIVTYAVYRQTISLLLDAADRQRREQHKPRSTRRRAR